MEVEAVVRRCSLSEREGSARPSSQHTSATFGVLYSCVTEVVELVTGHILPPLYCHRLSKTDEGHLTVRRLLVRRSWPDVKILQKFGKFQDLLDRDVRAMKKVDATFGYMIIKNICNNVFRILSAETRAKIALLPKYKFKICHSYGKDIFALKQEVRKLREFVSSIYSEMDEHFKCKVNNFILVTAVLNNTIPKLESCVEDRHSLRGLWSDSDVQVLISAQEELRQQYETLQVRGPFQFLTGKDQVQETILAPLRIGTVERGPPVLVKDLLTTTLIREDVSAAEVLLVGGEPGAGKTSLCYYLLRDWCRQTQQVGGLEHADLVLLVEWARVRGYASLNSYLLDSLLGRTRAKYPEQLCAATSLVKYDLLVLIDGFSARENKEGELLQDVFQLFNKNCVLMTTEPADLEYIESVFVARNNSPSVTVSLCRLNRSIQLCLAAHACRVAAASTEESQRVSRQFKEHHSKGLDRVLNHCREPATTLVYAALWRPNAPSPSTPSHLHRFLLEGLYEKFLRSCQDAPSQTYKRNPARLFHQLGELAWGQLCRNYHRVPQDIARALEVEELLPVLFTATVDNSVSPSKFTYTFASLSQQLHLAAIFLARKIIRDSSYAKFLEEKLFIWEKYPELLLFTVGELNHFRCDPTNLRTILKLSHFTPVRAEDYEYWCLLEQESCHSPVVTRYVAETLATRHWCLSSTTVVPGLKLLARTPVAVESIAVDIATDTEPYHIPELVEALQEVRASLKRRVTLELHLWRHYVCGGVKPSNQLLHAFTLWCTITNFTGEIGPETGEAPVFESHRTRTLRVRVSSPAAFHTLRGVTRRLTRVCQYVRVTLALPDGCSLAQLEPVDYSNLHLTLEEVHEENMSWVIGVVRRMARRQPIWRLCLNTCSLSAGSMPGFFRKLRGFVADKISLCTLQDVDDRTQRRLKEVAGCTISWL